MNQDIINLLVDTIANASIGYMTGHFIAEMYKIYTNMTNVRHYKINRTRVRMLANKDLKRIKPIDVRFKYTEEINNFIDTLKLYCPYADFSLFDRNIADLIIEEYSLKDKDSKFYTSGTYLHAKNAIRILTGEDKGSLTHELLHMSSTFFTGVKSYSGFKYYDIKNKVQLGGSINEGYTCLLDYRLFDVEPGYILSFGYASLIESIVGQENMVKLYFTHNLTDLIKSISKYCDEESAFKLITNLDKFSKIMEGEKFNKEELEKDKDEIQQLANDIAETLFTCELNYRKQNNIPIDLYEISHKYGIGNVIKRDYFTITIMPEEIFNKVFINNKKSR